MRIDVGQLLKGSVGASQRCKVNEFVGKVRQSFVKGEVVLIRTAQGILVEGTMTASVSADCSRCLSPTDHVVDFHIEEEFFPRSGVSSLLSEVPDGFMIENEHILDLDETFRQYILASMPVKLLCRPDCAGVCTSCGHDLNQSSCQCSSHAYDLRWSKLVCLREEGEI